MNHSQQSSIQNRESSIENRESSYLRAYKALHLSRTLYKSALFMQNKPNFRKPKINVNIYYIKDYHNFIPLTGQKNKPNSKPIAKRVKLMHSLYLQRITKKNAAKGYEKTKPKQTQFLQMPKWTQISLSQRIMKMIPPSGPKKQTQTNPISNRMAEVK